MRIGERGLHTLLGCATDLLAVLSADGRFSFAAGAGAGLFGLDPDDLPDHPLAERTHPDDRDRVRTLTARWAALAPGDAATAVFRLRDGSGTWRPVEATGCNRLDDPEIAGIALTIRDASAHTVHPLPTARDAGERRRIERELTAARDAARAADRAKSAFLATMSHELRTPLNAVIGFAQVIEMRLPGTDAIERYVEYATAIRRSGEHLLGIIDDVLDLAMVEAGAIELAEDAVHPVDLMAQALDMIAMQAGERGVALVPEPEPGLPPVRGDARRLRQIMLNLLNNAVAYTGAGGRVTAGVRRAGDGGVELWVEDTGSGMSADGMSDALLSPFATTNRSLTCSHGGIGIGLPLAARLAGWHGGHLTIDSRPGPGTTVRVHLPAERVLATDVKGVAVVA